MNKQQKQPLSQKKEKASPLQQKLSYLHTSSVLNLLLKQQHRILIKELAKIQKLNTTILNVKQKILLEHRNKMDKYMKIRMMLKKQIQEKQKMLSQKLPYFDQSSK